MGSMVTNHQIGETVWWSGTWGKDEPKLAMITDISVDNDEIIYFLDNGHWAYSYQIRGYD